MQLAVGTGDTAREMRGTRVDDGVIVRKCESVVRCWFLDAAVVIALLNCSRLALQWRRCRPDQVGRRNEAENGRNIRQGQVRSDVCGDELTSPCLL